MSQKVSVCEKQAGIFSGTPGRLIICLICIREDFKIKNYFLRLSLLFWLPYDCPSIGLNQNKDNAPQKRENDRKCQNDYHKRGIGLIPLSISLDIKHKVIFLEIFPNNRDRQQQKVMIMLSWETMVQKSSQKV